MKTKPKKQYRVVLFDVDDTIFQYVASSWHSLQNTCQSLGLPCTPAVRDYYRELDKRMWDTERHSAMTIPQLLDTRGREMARWLGKAEAGADFARIFYENMCREIVPVPGMAEVLREIYRDFRLYTASNGVRGMQEARLIQAGLRDCFVDIPVSDDLGYEKPDPRFFTALFAQYGVSAEEVLMVGDNLRADIGGSVNAGIDCCWFNWLRQPNDRGLTPTYEIAEAAELLKILQ